MDHKMSTFFGPFWYFFFFWIPSNLSLCHLWTFLFLCLFPKTLFYSFPIVFGMYLTWIWKTCCGLVDFSNCFNSYWIRMRLEKSLVLRCFWNIFCFGEQRITWCGNNSKYCVMPNSRSDDCFWYNQHMYMENLLWACFVAMKCKIRYNWAALLTFVSNFAEFYPKCVYWGVLCR
jgi:hypothetical protein